MKNQIIFLQTLSGANWTVGEQISGGSVPVFVMSIEEVFHKSFPVYYIKYSDGRFVQVPVTSTEFVRGE